MPKHNAPHQKSEYSDTTGAFTFMGGYSDDDYMISDRDLSAFTLTVMMACSKAEVASIIALFETSEEYFSENFPDLAKQVADLPDAPPTPE